MPTAAQRFVECPENEDVAYDGGVGAATMQVTLRLLSSAQA